MLRAIQFNDQLCRSTVKARDKSANDPLFINFYRIFAKKKIPKLAFMHSHLSAESTCIF